MKTHKPLPLIPPLPHGTEISLPREWFENNDERGIIARLIIDKRYFGSCYRELQVVFKILCHSPKLCKKQGMTPCKTLTLTKP